MCIQSQLCRCRKRCHSSKAWIQEKLWLTCLIWHASFNAPMANCRLQIWNANRRTGRIWGKILQFILSSSYSPIVTTSMGAHRDLHLTHKHKYMPPTCQTQQHKLTPDFTWPFPLPLLPHRLELTWLRFTIPEFGHCWENLWQCVPPPGAAVCSAKPGATIIS